MRFLADDFDFSFEEPDALDGFCIGHHYRGKMNRTELEGFCAETLAADEAERMVKGDDYSRPDVDALSNFKESAHRLGTTPIKEWATHYTKHTMAIERFVRDGCVSSEAIRGRFRDARNYLLLGEALLAEAELGDA